jgi:hypothetical protein
MLLAAVTAAGFSVFLLTFFRITSAITHLRHFITPFSKHHPQIGRISWRKTVFTP